MEKVVFLVHGMKCAGCGQQIEKKLLSLPGIKEVSVHYPTTKVTVHFQTDQISPNDIAMFISKLGYTVINQEDTNKVQLKSNKVSMVNRFGLVLFSLVFTIPFFFSMLGMMGLIPMWPGFIYDPFIQFILATPVQFIAGRSFYLGAYHSIRNRMPNMDLLVALGTSASYFYSLYLLLLGNHHVYFETSTMIITLVLLGKNLEQVAREKVLIGIEHLIDLKPKVATVLQGDEERETPVSQLVVGNLLRVRPGQKIPVDGEIIKGRSTVNESMFTGESISVAKKVGDQVYGGSINEQGSFLMEATGVGNDTILAQIVRLVEEAQSSKAPIQRLADLVAGRFVIIVLSIALVMASVWYVYFDPGHMAQAIQIFTSILVIACPCALGLATPISLMVGIGAGARNGILIKNGGALEALHQVTVVLLDKTGTITEGKPKVTDMRVYQEWIDKDQILALGASIEKQSEHPLGLAIVHKAEEQGCGLYEVKDFHSEPGFGVKGTIDDKEVLLGNHSYLVSNEIPLDEKVIGDITQIQEEGKTGVLISVNKTCVGLFGIADTVQSNARQAIKELKKLNLEVIMLTGDNHRVAQQIAHEVGIDHVIADLLPQQKAQRVTELKSAGKKVVMVGDGVNDAPALAIADVGVAMGTGTDVALETGEIALLGSLHLLPGAIRLSIATMNNIRQNLFWAFFYNSVGIPIAAAGLLSPWIAGAAMAFSSLFVVGNAFRLKRNVKLAYKD